MKILSFIRKNNDSGLHILHHLMARSGSTGCGIIKGEFVIAQTDSPEKIKAIADAHLELLDEENLEIPETDWVRVECNFVASSKKEDLWVSKTRALDKFLALTGLDQAAKLDSNSHPWPVVIPMGVAETTKEKVKVINRFEISGNFKVIDREKFENAMLSGVGKRKTYGYGLILAKDLD